MTDGSSSENGGAESSSNLGDEGSSAAGEVSATAEQNSFASSPERPRSRLYMVYRLATSVPLLLLAILLLMEIWLRQGNPIDALNIRSVDAWGAAKRLQLSRRLMPQVVLIGSSLILALVQDDNGRHYLTGSDPMYLRGLLDKATGQKITTVDLATGAQMASESYFMAEAACNARSYPGVIIYGVALRDFIDNRMGGEWMTESFNSIAPFAPLFSATNIFSLQGMREFVFCHYFYLYRNRGDFKNLLSVHARELLENLPLDKPFLRQGYDGLWSAGKNGTFKENWIPREREVFVEKMRLEHPERLRDYFKTVQTSASQTENKQATELSHHYFRCLQRLCQRKNILLVVVNMPFSPDISSAVPVKPMRAFREFLHKGELDGGYALIDLWEDTKFSDSDYKDGVHFNPSGTRKFSDILVQQLQTRFPKVLDRMASQAAGKQ